MEVGADDLRTMAPNTYQKQHLNSHPNSHTNAERRRLDEAETRRRHWRKWGPYLAERSWGVVREDYSAHGDAWGYFPHDHARSRAYRWTEDGILGISDNHQRLCFALALWNGKDPILKERLFGLSNPEGNHGEDVKEAYYYLEATPTASYLKGLYRYPHEAFPYERLVAENRARTRAQPELELEETGVFDGQRYFEITVEYAKRGDEDMVIRVVACNRGREAAKLYLLPTLWFRNTWSWGRSALPKPELRQKGESEIEATHPTLGRYTWSVGGQPRFLFTENNTNHGRLSSGENETAHVKDAFHDYLIAGKHDAVNEAGRGTKACALYEMELAGGGSRVLYFRLHRSDAGVLAKEAWPGVVTDRIKEAAEFYSTLAHPSLTPEGRDVQRQSFAGLFWSKQFYHWVVDTWLQGDKGQPTPPAQRHWGRNHGWRHLFNDDVISMPDKWEYPWYAAWDLAFQAVAMAPADPGFAKEQLSLFLREWYMHPNGAIPAYEWSLDDANPPVQAWACWRVYQIDRRIRGTGDTAFLEGAFHKLLLNFTWWVNRKDSQGANIFEGGFLGLDNIGLFDRNTALPKGWRLEQSDASNWMAMYCLQMLTMALELADRNPTYESIASKFFEHFLYIADAINHREGTGLWDEEDGFYYDHLRFPDRSRQTLRVRSMVGITALFAAETLEQSVLDRSPKFKKRMRWFIENRPDLTAGLAPLDRCGKGDRILLSVLPEERLRRVLHRVFDEAEFLSPFGIRSLSKHHKEHPVALAMQGEHYRIEYEPGESQTGVFGGNSNWRGPVWFPLNYLLVEALQRLHHFYGHDVTVAFPTGSEHHINLGEAAAMISQRLTSLLMRDKDGRRPADGECRVKGDPHFYRHPLFYEYFHGDTGAGLGASHQTGWTGLAAKLLGQSGMPDERRLADLAEERKEAGKVPVEA